MIERLIMFLILSMVPRADLNEPSLLNGTDKVRRHAVIHGNPRIVACEWIELGRVRRKLRSELELLVHARVELR